MHKFMRIVTGRIFAMVFLIGTAVHSYAHTNNQSEVKPDIQNAFGKLPLAFEENRGQADLAVKFLSRGPGYKLFLTAQEAVMVFSKIDQQHLADDTGLKSAPGNSTRDYQVAVVRMHFEDANQAPIVKGIEPLGFKTNYFVDADPALQFTDIANHARVKYTSLYPGVDLVYYGNQQRLEYDLLLAPRAKPQQIKLSFSGADKISLSKNGDLILGTVAGELIYHKPVGYQDIAGKRKTVDVDYTLADNGQLGFRVGRYDVSKPLVIDPIVSYSYPFWGYAADIAVDALGNVYVTGSTGTDSTHPTVLPTTGGYQTKQLGNEDAYIVKLDPSGTKVVYATYLGARGGNTVGKHIAVDASGNAYVTGTTDSSSFPVTAGAYQTTFQSSKTTVVTTSFLTKLNTTGNGLVYSTYVNVNSLYGSGISIAIDGMGNAYLTGGARSIITTAGAFQTAIPNTLGTDSPFVAKLNPSGTAMVYATYLGGESGDDVNAIAVDVNGNAYVTGTSHSTNFPLVNTLNTNAQGAFVAKLNPTGTGLLYSTCLGDGAGSDIAVNAAGQAFVVGTTENDNFPVTPGVFQPHKGYPGTQASNGFITKLNAAGTLMYSSFIGGSWCSCSDTVYNFEDLATHVAVDSAGYAYIGGNAKSRHFPVIDSVGGPISAASSDQDSWPYVAKVSPAGDKLVYSTPIGVRSLGKGLTGMASDSAGSVYAVGSMTLSSLAYADYVNTIPVTAGAPLISSIAFIFKLSTGKYPTTVRTPLDPVLEGQPITLVADVLSTKSGGNVTFMDGAATLGVGPMNNGVAKLEANLSRGSHKITAIYSGDGIVSPPVFQIVNSK